MNTSPAYEQLVAHLAELHQRAVDGVEAANGRQAADDDRRVLAINSAIRAHRVLGLAQRASFYSTLRLDRLRPRLLSTSACCAVAVLAVVWFWRSKPRSVIVADDGAASHAVAAGSNQAARVGSPNSDPCAHSVRADGNQPLIDDFEHGGPSVAPREGRTGWWGLYTDDVSPGADMPIVPELRPQREAENRHALHAVGHELRDWGAVLEVAFRPTCYDARAYRGISFSAMGPGRLYVGVREVRVVPVRWGGTCTAGCYDTHQKKIELSDRWRRFEVEWSDLRQRGYGTPALDPSRIHSIGFQVSSGDTPFDFWIDDVQFLPRL